MNRFAERIHAIYDRHAPRQIHPFIGATFRSPQDVDLRIVAVGINAYVAPRDEPRLSPSWFAGWFRNQSHRYQRAVWRDLEVLGRALTAKPFRLATQRFAGMASIYLTNAVKVYLPEAEGKRAYQLAPEHFERHLDQWRDELDAMAELDVLPHVIVIIGEPFWPFACDAFRVGAAFERFDVVRYEHGKGSCLHYSNRVVLRSSKGEHELLLLRLRHPAARSSTMGSPQWLLAQPEMRALAAASSTP